MPVLFRTDHGPGDRLASCGLVGWAKASRAHAVFWFRDPRGHGALKASAPLPTAFGIVAAAVWLHILTPLQTASLIIAFGLVVQGYAVWKLRHGLSWSRLWPFLIGAALG